MTQIYEHQCQKENEPFDNYNEVEVFYIPPFTCIKEQKNKKKVLEVVVCLYV
jgi:hypothetical protein